MLNEVNKYVVDYIKNNNIIKIDNVVLYDNKKLEYALSIKGFMASVSVLSDYTYDFFATEDQSDNLIMVKTLYFNDIDELIAQIKMDLDDFAELGS